VGLCGCSVLVVICAYRHLIDPFTCDSFTCPPNHFDSPDGELMATVLQQRNNLSMALNQLQVVVNFVY